MEMRTQMQHSTAAEWMNNSSSSSSSNSKLKLKAVGGLWASALAASLAYACVSRPMLKPSLRLIHARIYAQGVTVAALSSAAAMVHLASPSSSNADAAPSPPQDFFFSLMELSP